ncbi:MAG: hypothetical protein K8F52_02960 [Candidatus Scalindua rubra]|uniref:Uncharacterized protein n=1 Tax=Candidatus Scalindua brodae TaxID=237368 RepID=A0A0B0ENL4_9BACT|nr:MAG: Bacterial protein of unknown function [Candidatus Scalindua brodae]MBZ0107606.1 hypothetical protein [Candidatus Scalindua rubra]
MKIFFLFFLITLIPTVVLAETKIEVGQTLPTVSLEGKDGVSGELKQNGEIKYINWDLENHNSKVMTILHLSARKPTEKNIQILVDLLDTETYGKFSKDHYITVNILNYDDIFSIFGISKPIAIKRFIKRFKKCTEAAFVLDDSSTVRDEWGLTEKGCAVILLDKNRKVVFYKDGDDKHVLLDMNECKVFLDKFKELINE